jgi:putative ABC transport system substrate-binding protein
MKRREFIAGLGAAAWPMVARAQQGERMRRVGVLINGTATDGPRQTYVKAFTETLRDAGWIEGKNISIDIRYNAGDAALARIFAAQLIGLMPDVILAASTTNLTIIREVTNTVPIVFVQISDPVAQGFVESMRRPGGNLTGFSVYEFSIAGKWLDLLKQVSPRLSRVAVMFNPDTSPQSKFFMQAIEAAAPSHGVQTIVVPVRATIDIEPALASFARQSDGGLLLPTDSFITSRYPLIADLAARYSLPSIAPISGFAKDGGLMEYSTSVNFLGQYRQAASYVDRILKGSKPADLPVQGADKYEFVINLKTAKALGLTIPETLLATADEVIQ